MLIQFNNYLIPYLVILPFAITFSIIIFKLRTSEDLKITSFLILACNIWATGYVLGIINAALYAKIIFSSMGYFGSVLVPSLFFILSAKLAGFSRLLKKDMLIILSIKPAADFLMFVVNNLQGLINGRLVIKPNGVLETNLGKYYEIFSWVWLGYDGILALLSIIFLFMILAGGYRFFRRQVVILLVAFVLGWGFELFYVLEVIPSHINMAPMVISFFSIIYWIFGYRYLKMGEVVPINYKSIIENINDGVLVLNKKDMVTFYNKPAQDLLSFGKDIMGKPVTSFWHDYNIDFREDEPEARKDIKINTGRQTRYFDVTINPVKKDKIEIAGKLIILKDITERKKYEDKIKYMSFHDFLTGLYNRAFFEEELKRLDTPRSLPLSVVLGDVNGLKIINDSYGHERGDELLIKIAEILGRCFRKSDIISRWGGDEFIILLPLTKYNQAGEIVRRIEETCLKYNTADMPISIALGISTKEKEDVDIEEIIKLAEDRMYRKKINDEERVHRSMISFLGKTLEKKEYETEKHVKRMEELALLIGKNMKLSKIELNELVMLSALHDIGKIAIDDSIILKPGKLTPEEWEIVKKHPEVGYRIVKSSVDLAAIADAILTHHENWDGSGYPKGLKGTEIPLLSRIISIADAYDVMNSNKPYRKAMNKKEAIAEIKRNSGTRYDPELVRIFTKIMGKKFK